jgi:membrane protein DedA with SNARE-associated domain
LQALIISIMNGFGYIGILLLIAIENLFPPIPSEVILTFGGFMTTTASLTPLGVILASTLGSLLGAVILYGFGRLLKPERLDRLFSGKIGRMLGFKAGDILKASDTFDRKGQATVFFCRMIPVVRSLISIPAGMANMPFLKFIVLTTAGSAIWNTALVYLGAAAGVSWPTIASFIDTYATVTLSVLGITLVVMAIIFYRKRFEQAVSRKT